MDGGLEAYWKWSSTSEAALQMQSMQSWQVREEHSPCCLARQESLTLNLQYLKGGGH